MPLCRTDRASLRALTSDRAIGLVVYGLNSLEDSSLPCRPHFHRTGGAKLRATAEIRSNQDVSTSNSSE